jgi:hypothetical protein
MALIAVTSIMEVKLRALQIAVLMNHVATGLQREQWTAQLMIHVTFIMKIVTPALFSVVHNSMLLMLASMVMTVIMVEERH